ncbi:MAG: hypothetical protein KGL39_13245 [Patescibacteria group bacterium]|nr:hypothetical protein [Patescibacteria group bacterium]
MDWKAAFDRSELTLAEVAKRLGYKSTGTISDLINHGLGSERLKGQVAKILSETEEEKRTSLSFNKTADPVELESAVDRAISELLTIKMHLQADSKKRARAISYGRERKNNSADQAEAPVPPAQTEFDQAGGSGPSHALPLPVPQAKLPAPKRHNIE